MFVWRLVMEFATGAAAHPDPLAETMSLFVLPVFVPVRAHAQFESDDAVASATTEQGYCHAFLQQLYDAAASGAATPHQQHVVLETLLRVALDFLTHVKCNARREDGSLTTSVPEIPWKAGAGSLAIKPNTQDELCVILTYNMVSIMLTLATVEWRCGKDPGQWREQRPGDSSYATTASFLIRSTFLAESTVVSSARTLRDAVRGLTEAAAIPPRDCWVVLADFAELIALYERRMVRIMRLHSMDASVSAAVATVEKLTRSGATVARSSSSSSSAAARLYDEGTQLGAMIALATKLFAPEGGGTSNMRADKERLRSMLTEYLMPSEVTASPGTFGDAPYEEGRQNEEEYIQSLARAQFQQQAPARTASDDELVRATSAIYNIYYMAATIACGMMERGVVREEPNNGAAGAGDAVESAAGKSKTAANSALPERSVVMDVLQSDDPLLQMAFKAPRTGDGGGAFSDSRSPSLPLGDYREWRGLLLCVVKLTQQIATAAQVLYGTLTALCAMLMHGRSSAQRFSPGVVDGLDKLLLPYYYYAAYLKTAKRSTAYRRFCALSAEERRADTRAILASNSTPERMRSARAAIHLKGGKIYPAELDAMDIGSLCWAFAFVAELPIDMAWYLRETQRAVKQLRAAMIKSTTAAVRCNPAYACPHQCRLNETREPNEIAARRRVDATSAIRGAPLSCSAFPAVREALRGVE